MSLRQSASALKAVARQAPQVSRRSYSALTRRAAVAAVAPHAGPQFIVRSARRHSRVLIYLLLLLNRPLAVSRRSNLLVSKKRSRTHEHARSTPADPFFWLVRVADSEEVVYERSDWPLPKLQECVSCSCLWTQLPADKMLIFCRCCLLSRVNRYLKDETLAMSTFRICYTV